MYDIFNTPINIGLHNIEMRERAFGVIPPQRDLQRRIGGQLKPMEGEQAPSLQKAMQTLAGGMSCWINTNMDRLHMARNALLNNAESPELIINLHRVAHDLRAWALPMAFLSCPRLRIPYARPYKSDHGKGRPDLVNAHVDALRAVVNLNVRDPDSGPATELVRGPNDLVAKKTAD